MSREIKKKTRITTADSWEEAEKIATELEAKIPYSRRDVTEVIFEQIKSHLYYIYLLEYKE